MISNIQKINEMNGIYKIFINIKKFINRIIKLKKISIIKKNILNIYN